MIVADFRDKKSVEAGLVKKDSDRAGQAPYVTEQRPQYNIDEKSHSIGLRWEGWDNNCRESNNCELKEYHLDKETGLDRKKMFIPYLPANPVIPTDGTRQKNQAEKLLAPQATMSLYDLPGLLFYQYLLHGLDKCQAGKYVETEKYIKDYHRNLWKFFSDMSDGKITPLGKQSVNVKKDEDLWKQRKADLEVLLQEKYQLHVTDIPSKLVGFLCRKGIDYDIKMKESALRRLAEKKDAVEKALKSHKEKVKRIGTKENKFDKMRATIKTGQLAQWLIRDIWSWLPNDSGCLKRLTGQSYVALQSAISMLGQQFQDSDEIALDVKKLRSIFQRAGLVAAPNEPVNNDHHPFLVNVFEKCMSDFSVEAFYVQYLICELKHIREVVKVIEKGKDYHKIPFLHCGRQRWKEQDENTMRKLAGRYLDQPIQLPDGMFSSPILRLLSEQYPDKLQEMLNAAQQTSEDRQLARNVSYLIRIYFEHVEKDHSQPFYNTAAIDGEASPYRHVYRIFKKLYGQKISRTNRTTSPAYTIEEIMNLRKKALEDIGRFVDCEIQNWENRQQSKFEYKLREKLQKENDRRYKRREKQLNINEEVKKAIGQEIDNMRQEITRKLERQLAKVYDNERTIRRFKTQDILLFLMAREIQKTKSNEHDFYLKYIMAG